MCARTEEQAPRQIAGPAPLRVLLVDDREENLLALSGTLRGCGAALDLARSGPEALERLLQHEYAVAVVDVQMPEMDGFELVQLMRGAERTKRTPVLFVTAGELSSGAESRGYGVGAVDYLRKPYDPDILRAKVNVFLRAAGAAAGAGRDGAAPEGGLAPGGGVGGPARRHHPGRAGGHRLRRPRAPLSQGERRPGPAPGPAPRAAPGPAAERAPAGPPHRADRAGVAARPLHRRAGGGPRGLGQGAGQRGGPHLARDVLPGAARRGGAGPGAAGERRHRGEARQRAAAAAGGDRGPRPAEPALHRHALRGRCWPGRTCRRCCASGA